MTLVRDDELKEGAAAQSVGKVVIIGGGPAGLTAAYELSRNGVPVTVLEADTILGGIARTASYRGYLFDIGGHRFYTKVKIVEQLWKEVLGEDLLWRQRLSRIYFQNKFFRYPLDPWDTVIKLGPLEAARCVTSWARAVIAPKLPEADLQTWVTNRFGKRLFQLFFRSYTEKVWGMRCDQISSDWAAQRIRGLSLKSLLQSTFSRWKHRSAGSSPIKTLIEAFYYPRRGPGAMWETMARRAEEMGSEIVMQAKADRIDWEPGRVLAVHANGQRIAADHVISSMPVRDFVRALEPPAPAELVDAANNLAYRDFITVALIIRKADVFPDNWIYIHDPAVKVGRIQNFKNWSPDMVPDPDATCLGLEYFCFEGDALWSMADAELIEFAKAELVQLGLAQPDALQDGAVVRMPKAYPVYNSTYKVSIQAVREFLTGLPNLQLVGRNGMHQYNNQDHSMLTAILAARNILGGSFNLWNVNVDGEYLEEGREVDDPDLGALRTRAPLVPAPVPG